MRRLIFVLALLCPAVAGAQTLATDTFTDTVGTLLDAHTGESCTWGIQASSFSPSTIEVDSVNRIMGNTFGQEGYHYCSVTPPSADYDVSVSFVLLTAIANNSMGVCGRMETAGQVGYCLYYDPIAAIWQLYEVPGFVQIGSNYSMAFSVSTHTAMVQMRGSTISGWIDGVQQITGTNSTITAAGKGGLRSYWGVADTTGVHLDNFSMVGGGGHLGLVVGVGR